MALTAVEYAIFAELKKAGRLPPHPSLLELGEANWYGDVPLDQLTNDICQTLSDRDKQIALLESLLATVQAQKPDMPWAIAKIFYRTFLDYRETVAIDFHGTDQALRLDLNQPIALGRTFDIVINGGTSEHVFNVWQFYKTVHDHTGPGGLMVHAAPFTGWLDHGFYNFNPTFFWDLAAANGYTILLLYYSELTPLKMIRLHKREQIAELAQHGQIGEGSHLYAVFKKPDSAQPFATPQQGYYADTVSDRVKNAWLSLR